jgi:Predicted carbamoyl transferase, NodU family
MGEPIINTPSEAIKCFFDSGLDAMFLGNYLLKK